MSSMEESKTRRSMEEDDGMSLEHELNRLLEEEDGVFSVESYLNLALSGVNGGGEEEEQRMAELALQLQVQTQACHEDIGRIGAELRAVLPRCAGDMERLGLGVASMKEDVANILVQQKQMHSSKDDKEKLETLETLSTLHALRSNLSLTKSILTAASSWDSTMASIPSLLSNTNTDSSSSSSLHEAVKALAQLQLGAHALRGMPGLQERQNAIASIKSDILKLLKPQLLHALQRMDTRLAPLQQCVSMYNTLGHVQDVLMEEYVKQRPSHILQLWFQFSSTTTTTTTTHQTEHHPNNNNNDNNDDDFEFYTANDDKPKKPSNTDTTTTTATATNSINVIDTATAFVQWLPTWYEAILTLLTEERRRAQTVFGSELAPEIIAKVLSECFRPIISSFKSRLFTIYPPSAHEGGASTHNSGSLESICAAYEATLQFLAEAYDQMASMEEEEGEVSLEHSKNKNHSNSRPKRNKTPHQLYQYVCKLFTRIASPFAPYQIHFSPLEDHYSGCAARMVARDIANAVRIPNNNKNVAMLQESVEKLQGLAPYMFPLAQAALARFELLNCGYKVVPSLHTVDQLLSRHIGELLIAVDTLAANMDTSTNLESWELEPHLSCALDVLKMTGAFAQSLHELQNKTRERLQIALDRMITHDDRRTDVIPDSLSPVEVQTMLAKYVCCKYQQEMEEEEAAVLSITKLKKLANKTTREKTLSLFPESMDAISRLSKTCHTFIFDVCFIVPKQYLSKMSSLPTWKEGETNDEDSWGAEHDQQPSYGTLPQSYITHVGEHMLALVQALEPFASDTEALKLTSLVMDGLQDVAKQPWKDFAGATHHAQVDPQDDETISVLMNGTSLLKWIDLRSSSDSAQLLDEPYEDQQQDPQEEDSASAEFCNKWLDVVCCAVTGRLLERILRIPRLTSPKTCEQLSVDVDYLVNVFSALGVSGHPHSLLEHVANICTMDAEEWKLAIGTRTFTPHSAVTAVRAAENCIATIRGISLT